MTRSMEKRRGAAFSLLMAAVLLLFFSRCSPLYPTNSWSEANAYLTLGRGVLAGKVPYRDLIFNAGPLMIALHALSYSFTGVWALEIVALAASIYFAWRMAVRSCRQPLLAMALVSPAALLVVSSRAFICGDTAEEFALPLQLCSLCALTAYLQKPKRRMPLRRVLLHGLLCGCVF